MNPTAHSKESRSPLSPVPGQEKAVKTVGKSKTPKTAEARSQAAEAAPIASEKAAAQPPQFTVPPLALPASPPPVAAHAAAGAAAVPPATDVSLVDDGDLIEKEWVNKAKEIVAKTRDDPYVQSEELTVFKADYMKKRYDKHIKLST